MGLIRFLLFALLFYLVIKIARKVINYFISPKGDDRNSQEFKKNKKKSTIDKKDIIEAEFEEIDEDKDKSNN